MKLQRLAIITSVTALLSSAVWAADHIDSPAATSEPTADISDLYAWMDADATHLNLVLNVSPFASEKSAFSDAVVYALHVGSSKAYGEAQTETPIICQFFAADMIECWAGDEYVTGAAGSSKGLLSKSGKLKVFAGLRDDPFFFELAGFKETVKAVVAAAPDLKFDEQMCPLLPQETSAALVAQLQSGPKGVAATDTFAGANVLSLVIQVDKSVVDAGGPLLSAWASTHAAK